MQPDIPWLREISNSLCPERFLIAWAPERMYSKARIMVQLARWHFVKKVENGALPSKIVTLVTAVASWVYGIPYMSLS